MTGYTTKPDMPASGVHDPLQARALVLDDGETCLALVALDLIRLNPGRLPELVRAQGVDHVLLVATHTHGGPLVLDLSGPLRGEQGLARTISLSDMARGPHCRSRLQGA